MTRRFISILAIVFCMCSCKKETVHLNQNTNEVFWLSNAGADMPVWVKGNTASHVMILFLHGGPGDGSYQFVGFQTNQLWKNYSFAYWDQRDAGSAAGNSNYSNLNLAQMIEDLQKLVAVIHYRYGNDMEIFLMGHSFGGLLGCGYLVQNSNQANIKAWIEVDGAHDYPLADKLERRMLIDTGTAEIQKGNYVSEWKNIVSYCKKHPVRSSVTIGRKTDDFAADAESYVNINHTKTAVNLFSVSSPVSLGTNLFKLYFTPAGNKFLQEIITASFTNQLNKITIPSLLIWGQYDFTVPMGCGYDELARLSSSYKKLVLMPRSGHIPMDGDPDLFAKTVSDFIEVVK
ncbi:MAG: alpha/beta hydrolase [Ginsengibacter sp.]